MKEVGSVKEMLDNAILEGDEIVKFIMDSKSYGNLKDELEMYAGASFDTITQYQGRDIELKSGMDFFIYIVKPLTH